MEGELTPLDTMLTDYWLLSYQSTDKVISSKIIFFYLLEFKALDKT